MNRGLCVFAIALVIAVKSCAGIRCWVCDGKRTLKDCHAQYGQMLQCPNDDDVCQNDYRTAEGKPLITKGCKQATACDTEVKQNKDKNQCGRRRVVRNMVCRCCCTTDGCNSKESGCIPPPAPCKKIKSPRNGESRCPRHIDFGSRCLFGCKQGYKRKGPVSSTCVRVSKGSKKGAWKPEKIPVCEKIIIKCDPPRVAPENGFIECQNSKEYAEMDGLNYEGSRCIYSCKKNFYVEGKRNTVCGNNRRWSNAAPTCKTGQCVSSEVDPNRVESCADGHNFGSRCDFSCKKGYNLIGPKKSLCQQSGDTAQGLWSNSFPRCVEVLCYPRLTNPSNGKVTCTQDNAKNSACTYACNVGYDMDQTREQRVKAVCEDDGDGDALGKWSRTPPTCSKIRCEPTFLDPKGGQVVCTDRNMYGSKCTFSCDGEHDLEGTTEPVSVSSCHEDGDGDGVGNWSQPAADCKPITCEPAFEVEKNEKLSCTNGNAKDSVCTFTCADDYDLDGTTQRYETSTCVPPKSGTAVGKWSRVEKPKCVPITCSPMPFPDNGFRICSTFYNIRGTFCLFYCGDGYDRIGQGYTSCQKGKQDGVAEGEWTAPASTCRLGQCSATKYNKETVIEDCTPPDGYQTSEYMVGTECRYRCKNEAYYMVQNVGNGLITSGELTATCDTEKQWTANPPRCLMKICLPVLEPPINGYTPKCTRGNEFNSECVFSCQEKYAPSHDRRLVCEADGNNDQYGKWSDDIPTCKRSHCDEFGIVIHGRLNCSDGTKIGSVCDLECIKGYTTKRYEETECLPTVLWSQRRYFCCVKCLFNRRIKIAAAFDSSAFKNHEDWKHAIDFTEAYLKLMLRYTLDVQFTAFTYSDDVDLSTSFPLVRMRSEEDLKEVLRALNSMHYGGHATYTGRALQHANDVVFGKAERRRREQFVILTTGGRSVDDISSISRQLRDRNVNILATGVNVDKPGERQLVEMTGTSRNVFTTDSLRDIETVPAKIFEISRSTGCTAASKSQPCP